ncbi:hypothetical protein R1sor_022867 [Riccia sorocarpa]|uniref:Endonuclease/exonuclease/phosphatase domain-containing protein n=1 Tax=Riccia sorocarpa TaxID=122646 RepID=A0ABD3GMN0_9MARC
MQTSTDFKVASWNLNGAADPDRVRMIRQWLRRRTDLGIIAFQELKAKESQAEWNMRSIFPNGKVVIDYAVNEKGGAALVVAESHKVIDSGVRGDGTVAWAKIDTPNKGMVGVVSIYAPTKSPRRIPLWIWLKDLLEEGNWILLGDFNCVELPEDTQGTSNLLNGGELRRWKDLTRASELIDCFFTVVTKKGPRYTRQRIRLDRVEFARLDRIYITGGADWVEQVIKLNHDGSSGLSDHYPIVGEFQLNPAPAHERTAWRTYFKFRAEEMRAETVRTQIELAWKNHSQGVSDPRVKWELSWKRVKKVMQTLRKEAREKESAVEPLMTKLEGLRALISRDNTLENRKQLAALEEQVKQRELKDARAWRLRSRTRWLREGDAPSQYFFAILKSKCKREEMLRLELEDGSEVTDKGEILRETHKFYQSLFSEDDKEQAEDPVLLLQECLDLVDRRLNPSQKEKLDIIPNIDEIEHIVKILPPEKAPGLDGITSEVIRENWSLIREDCLQMLESFWMDGKLTTNMRKGTIKLIPKTADKSRLRDWHPISLLGITYKIISKLLAERLKMLLPDLVSPQQTGSFLWGRNAEGASKKALVSWNKICRRKEDGGRNLVCFELQARALKMRLVTKLLENEDLDWVHIAKTILIWKILDTKSRADEVGRPVHEDLILGNRMGLGDTPTLAKILEGWWAARSCLKLKDNSPIPCDIRLDQALRLVAEANKLREQDITRMATMCAKVGMVSGSDLNEEGLRALETLDRQGGRRMADRTTQGPLSKAFWVLSERLRVRFSTEVQTTDPNIWTWSKDGKQLLRWKHSTREWRWLLQGRPTPAPNLSLNTRWQCDWSEERWCTLWTKLWGGLLFLCDKTWIWRLLNSGLFVHEKLLRMRISDGLCPRGCAQIESIEHCLMMCTKPVTTVEILTLR